MLLGLNISHDASAALVDESGIVHGAIQEERISRIKNHVGIPRLSILELIKTHCDIEEVIIGTYENPPLGDAIRLLANRERNPSNKEGYWDLTFPGFYQLNSLESGKEIIQRLISEIFQELDKEVPKYTWVNHHDAHLGCAYGVSKEAASLLFSLDGEGDGESGAIALHYNSQMKILSRISRLDSLGNLYSAVTTRYNFRAGKHEGKITGFAAYGAHSEAVELLLNFVQVKNGIPKILLLDSLKKRLLSKSLRAFNRGTSIASSLEEIVMLAESKTQSYPDLAFAIQVVLEKAVCEIINFWIEKTSTYHLSLAGGVFANVKLNQRISEIDSIKSINIFPNMGDGGLSLGGVWAVLMNRGTTLADNKFENMYLAPVNIDKDAQELHDLRTDHSITVEYLTDEALSQKCVNDINSQLIVAVHRGQMEFGPRALGNRSIIVDARSNSILNTLNSRLQRTEFMPFAPIVLEELASEYFELPSGIQPFYFMTMTCNVKKKYRELLPAITHIDGTARPQLVSYQSNNFMYTILSEFYRRTGLGVMVNTSFNIHEEPINYSLRDSVRALKLKAIDVIYGEGFRIYPNHRKY